MACIAAVARSIYPKREDDQDLPTQLEFVAYLHVSGADSIAATNRPGSPPGTGRLLELELARIRASTQTTERLTIAAAKSLGTIHHPDTFNIDLDHVVHPARPGSTFL